jgi:hypothetical protein
MSAFPVTAQMCALYDYAFQGINSGIDWDIVELDFYGFFAGLKNFYPLDTGDFLILPLSLKKCMHTLDLAAARAELNGDDDNLLNFSIILTGGTRTPAGMLPLRHVALLADLDEKTVRNLAGPKSKHPLATKSVANRTYVEIDVVKEWLRARGAVVDTIYASKNYVRDLALTGFLSVDDLSNYVHERLGDRDPAQGLSRLTEEDRCRIAELKSEKFEYDMKFCIRLAHILELDPVVFTGAALKLFQSIQLQQLQFEVQKELDFG